MDSKNLIKKLIAILVIFTMLLADFLIIGEASVSYAIDLFATNNDNVQFVAYFVDSNNQETTNIDYSIADEEKLKLKFEIMVANQGYLDGIITLEDANFSISQNTESEYINRIENNTIYLNQINAGTTAEFELEVEPIENTEISLNQLSKETAVNLIGTYVNDQREIEIEGTSKITVNWKSPEQIEAEFSAEILTNKTYRINDQDKKVIQILVKSNLKNDIYPIKNTNIELNVPDGVEDIKVHSRTTQATNADTLSENYQYNEETNTLTINIENPENGTIKWEKHSEDAIIITYIYPETQNMQGQSISVKDTITTYDEKQVENTQILNVSEEIDGIVSYELENEEEIYKGKIYTEEERDYETKSIINIDYAELLNKLEITEKQALYKQLEEEKQANIEYKQTKISKEKFLEVFGEQGYITIQDRNGNILGNITSESETDEHGDIIINYQEGIKEIVIKTSAPTIEATMEIEHTKTIKSDGYSKEEKRALTEIKEEIEGKYTKNDETEVTQTAEKEIILKETETQIGVEIEQDTLSANTDEYQQIKMQIVLKANKENQDTYKNPTIKIEFPEQISEIASNVKLLYGNGLGIENTEINNENGKFVLNLELNGEQTKYLQEAEEGSTIVINTMVKLKDLTPSSSEQIIVKCLNENAINAEEVQETLSLDIINEKSIVLTNKIDELNIDENEDVTAPIEIGEEKTITVESDILNNEGTTIKDVKILGKIPTISDENNTEINLTSLVSTTEKEGIKVYYTEVENPTTDLEDENNRWEEVAREQSKNYLIVIDEMEQGERLSTIYELNITANTYDLNLETSYNVTYTDTISLSEKQVNSAKIMLTTETSQETTNPDTGDSEQQTPEGENPSQTGRQEISQEIEAKVGTDILEDGTEIKAGEIIDYTIRLTNTGETDVADLVVTANISEEFTYIEYNEGYNDNEDEDYIGGAEYRELYTAYEDVTEKTFENVNIAQGQTIELKYSVIVKEEVTDGTEVTTTVNSSNDLIDESTQITHTLSSADIVASISRPMGENDEDKLEVGSEYMYVIKVKNISDEDKENVHININMNDLMEIEFIEYIVDDESFLVEEPEFNLGIIKAGEEISIDIYVTVKETTDELNGIAISAILTDSENITYRTNEIREEVEKMSATVEITSDVEEDSISVGDMIIYNITVTNTGELNIEDLYVEDMLPTEYLEVQRITLNSEEIEYTTNETVFGKIEYTYIEIQSSLNAGESATIQIEARVKENITLSERTEFTNTVSIYNLQNLLDETELTSYINANSDTSGVTDDPTDTENPSDTNNPENPNDDNNNNSENPSTSDESTYSISGTIWLDENKDGIRDSSETLLSNIEVTLLDVTNNQIAQNNEGINIIAITNNDGTYTLSEIPEGRYIVMFEYDSERYILTTYQVEGANSNQNSDAITKTIEIDGENRNVAATDTLEVNDNIQNIDLGLVEAQIFDLELNKYVTRMVVTNAEGTETYNFDDETLAKVEIAARYLSGSTVVVEYKIEVTNTGEIAGYASSIVDYFPAGLTFNSSLNPDWYQSGSYIYNTSLADEIIEPGETKELILTATKTMTESNTGLVNNKAEIAESYNSQGIADTDSTVANQANNEDDIGSADITINVKTGEAVTYIALIIAIITLTGIAAYLINKKVLIKKI